MGMVFDESARGESPLMARAVFDLFCGAGFSLWGLVGATTALQQLKPTG